jgi:hypothetical protein
MASIHGVEIRERAGQVELDLRRQKFQASIEPSPGRLEQRPHDLDVLL